MNNQLKPRQLSIVLTLFTVLMLGSYGTKPEESTSTTPQTLTANDTARHPSGTVRALTPAGV